MDRDEAKFILAARRADGTDAEDALFAEALAFARDDVELKAWLGREEAFDRAVSRKLGEKEPPADLRARLLAGGRASRPAARRWRRRIWVLAIAASLLLVVGLSLHTNLTQRDISTPELAHTPLLDWQTSCVSVFANPLFSLDRTAADYVPLRNYLAASGVPYAEHLPYRSDLVSMLGCKALAWRGLPVSLTCVRDENGELAHLFVLDGKAISGDGLVDGPERGRVGDYSTLTWRQDGLLVLAASKLPGDRLEALLRQPSVVVAALGRGQLGFAAY